MLTAATYDYIETDFADAAETLLEYRRRTCPSRRGIVQRVCRPFSRVR